MTLERRLLAILACAAAAGAFVFSQQRGAGTRLSHDPSVISLRVRFGVTDTRPMSWDGSVSAESARVVNLRNWHPRPGDEVSLQGWKLSTRQGPNFVRRPVEEDQTLPPTPYLWHAGVIVDATPGAKLRFRTAQGNFDIDTSATSALNGRVAIDRVPAATLISDTTDEADFATLLGGNEMWAGWIAFRDNASDVKVRRFDGSAWGPEEVLASRADAFLVKLGRDRKGRAWAVWSEQRQGNFDLYGRVFDGTRWQPAERLTDAQGSDVYHAMATDAKGNLWLVWQGERNGSFDILARRFDGERWSAPETVGSTAANEWAPAIAADATGRVYVGWDTYDKGNYDIRMRAFDGSAWGAVATVADTPRYEAHVSLACDRQNRLWAAWNESGFEWGKDTGFLLSRQATPLYRSRWMSVAVYDGAEWKQPARNIEQGLPESLRGYNDLPQMQIDEQGRPWVFFRHRMNKFADTPDMSINHRAAWELYGVSYEGSSWSEPLFLPFSQGRTDVRFGIAADAKGRLWAAWPMDNRDFQDFLLKHSEVYAGVLPAKPSAPVAAALANRPAETLRPVIMHENEPADLDRIRSYSIDSAGSKYKIYRGDTHRHTEFSFDGNNDGTLLDTYRYALDAASLDFIGVSEHNNLSGPDHAYVNYLGQQAADVFHMRSRFVPLFAYERSVVYPNGHRNIIFAVRGNPALPTPPEEAKGKTGAKMLYEYLRQRKGIAISHTSATNMGTDWRDNDPEVEPLVEIYQGDRVSAEHEGAPKAAYAGNPSKQPGGYRPAGFVWNAWAKGYKLGVQASSDHLSTHLSYACAIATDFTREGLLDSMRKRHSYGATDNIVLDYRMDVDGREYIQGDIVPAGKSARLKVRVLGTRPVRQIDVIRNNTYIHTRQPMSSDVTFDYVDRDAPPGERYYYVRVIQVDEQMAWSSPIWIEK